MAGSIKFTVNGAAVVVDEQPGEMLADLLRSRLRLTGTKIGCNELECGACTVLVNGRPVLSCSYPATKVPGKDVITIEGLAKMQPSSTGVHPLQDAFVKYGAVQCGFCSPGQLMTAYALLRENPDPSEEDIKAALKDTLCRCGSYRGMVRAIQAAARSIKSGLSVELPRDIPVSHIPHSSVGKLVPRMDGIDKVTGKALYTDDLAFPGMLHARVKRAMVPSAVVRSIDVSQAKALPGVVAVLTAVDLPGDHYHGIIVQDWPILVGVGEKVRTVGDALALVAAETRDTANRALELIDVQLDPLPVVSGPVEALQSSAPVIHSHGNLLKHIEVRKGDVELGFAAADVVLEHTFFTPSYDHAFLEPECSIARPTPEGRMEVYVGSQIPYDDRRQVAAALGVPQRQVRIVGQLVGGGFGGKEDIAGQIHAALLAGATLRPVKLLFDRRESLLVHPKRHATQIRVKVGSTRDGKLTACETELYGDTGAYASLGEKVMTRATTHSSGPYEVPNVKADCFAMFTNNPPAGAFRGFGVLQSAFAIESAMDMLAERLRLDPVAIRRINALRAGSVTNTGQLLRESVGLQECIDRVQAEMMRLAGPDPFVAKELPGMPHVRRAWGFAVAYKNTGLGGGAPDGATSEVELFRDGSFEVRCSSAELGQGLPTVLQLIAAEELCVSPERVRVLLSDTDLTPDGGPTTASRQTYVTGNSVRQSAAALRSLIAAELSRSLAVPADSIGFSEGMVLAGGQALTFSEVSVCMIAGGQTPRVSASYSAPSTQALGDEGDMHFAFSFAAQAAEVEVDTRTGKVLVTRIVSANDVGAAINPLGLRAQIEGGAVMGLGHALTERFIVEGGYVITDHLARYRIPSISDVPEIVSIVVEHPVSTGPFGAKGVGEIVSIPTAPAITNALANAVGVRVDRLPIDQEMVLLELRRRAL
jgi:xanthine dehydrogenase molybdenum-binding subunit